MLYKLGNVLRARGDLDASIDAYDAAEKTDKDDGDGFFDANEYRLARAAPLWQLGRYKEALDELAQIEQALDELAQSDEAKERGPSPGETSSCATSSTAEASQHPRPTGCSRTGSGAC